MFYNDYSSHAYFLNSVCAYLYIIILNSTILNFSLWDFIHKKVIPRVICDFINALVRNIKTVLFQFPEYWAPTVRTN